MVVVARCARLGVFRLDAIRLPLYLSLMIEQPTTVEESLNAALSRLNECNTIIFNLEQHALPSVTAGGGLQPAIEEKLSQLRREVQTLKSPLDTSCSSIQ